MKVRKRPSSGVYMTDFRYTDPVTGVRRRHRRSTRSKKKRESLEIAERWKAALEKPPTPAHEVKKHAAFREFATRWLAIHAVNLKRSTVTSYEAVLRVHLVPFFGDQPLRSIGVEQVEMFKARVSGLGRSPKTINNLLAVGGRLFRSAVDWRYADTNPFWRAGRLKEPPTETAFWVREQSEAFLAAAQSIEPRWHPFFLTALHTGMRLGELFGLQWGDLDFVKRQIHIRRARRRGHVDTPKSNRTRRVPMTDRLHAALWGHRHLRSRLWVFTRRDGRPLTRDAVVPVFSRLTRAAGLSKIRFHDLRHSFASQLVMRGVPIVGVKELLGHADIKMTERYSHLSPAATAQYIRVLDDDNGARFGHVRAIRPVLGALEGGLN